MTELADSAANLTDTNRYDAFGALRSSSGASVQPFRFTGEQRESESSFYYLRARYYDPAIGRFLSRDPICSLESAYPYVRNNPASFVDPSGLWCPRNPEDCIPDPVEDWCKTRAADARAVALHTVTHPWTLLNGNLVNEALGGAISALSWCDRQDKEGGIVVYTNCGGLANWISNYMLGGATYTVGSFIFSRYEPRPELLQHETAPVPQYGVLGKWFLLVYGVMEFAALVSCGFDTDCAGGRHPLEQLADWQAGTDFY